MSEKLMERIGRGENLVADGAIGTLLIERGLRAGIAVYPESPELMEEKAAELVELGVAVIGGCCGTTPEHIRALQRFKTE